MFFVLAACKTSDARGLRQMQLADEYFLHNQIVSSFGPLLDLTQACTNNSESSKGQIDQDKFAAGQQNLFHFVVVWKKFWNDNQLYIRSQAVATFSAIAKALAGRMRRSRGPYVVQAWFLTWSDNRRDGLKTDNALCCITKREIPECRSKFEGMRDFCTNARRKVFRHNQKI